MGESGETPNKRGQGTAVLTLGLLLRVLVKVTHSRAILRL